VSEAPPAAWIHGGYVRQASRSGLVGLWRCHGDPCKWQRVTPKMSGFSQPFDAAAKLDLYGLTKPDPTRYSDRYHAIFSNWLPCYTVLSVNDPPGEDTVANAIIMAQRATPCPLTGVPPSSLVNQWLGVLTLPEGQLPGSSSDGSFLGFCARNGDLDITLVGLLHLILERQTELSPSVVAHLRAILAPWGGAPRLNPYITPNGTCIGFPIIETENHIMLQEVSRYFINSFEGQDSSANRDWLLRFLQQLARRDFYEFNALPYTRYHMKALYALHDYAPDPSVAVAARGILDWVFAKEALSANMDRDHRPFRRRPDPVRYAASPWWGSATTASLSEGALFAGPLQHVHEDLDLELDQGRDETGDLALADLNKYPQLGAADELFLDEFGDVADTKYHLPAAIAGWLQTRFLDDSTNRLTYLQEIHHWSPVSDDPALFLQTNSGVELVSGNRNWTIIAGGNGVAPGFPPDPSGGPGVVVIGLGVAAGAAAGALAGSAVAGPVGGLVGGLIGGLLGGGLTAAEAHSNALAVQTSRLWSDQPGIMRETTLIPSAVGLNRSQTIRFGQPLIDNDPNSVPMSRLCVAEGFLCGFDLVMPNRPFPTGGAITCPLSPNLPPAMLAYASMSGGGLLSRPILFYLGCFLMLGGTPGWSVWNFENGALAMGIADPPGKQRLAALWIENDDGPEIPRVVRVLHQRWQLPGQLHDWFNTHVYNTDARTSSGDAPGGDISIQTIGDPDDPNTVDRGEVMFYPDPTSDSTWSLITEGCDPKHGILGIRTGHTCNSDLMPRLDVNIAVPPAQPFSCAATNFRGQDLVLEVGSSCSLSPYGFFAYVWTAPCTGRCPPGATNYGFVVVAPSRGWTAMEFASIVETSIASQRAAAGHDYLPIDIPGAVDIPMSPPVKAIIKVGGSIGWQATGVPTVHTITFRFAASGGRLGNILGDTLVPSLFGPLTADPEKWPSALGHVFAPDTSSLSGELMHSGGNGCFTVTGVPLGAVPDPQGLLVDLRNTSSPSITEVPSSTLVARCP
jgi:hypothetical protein